MIAAFEASQKMFFEDVFSLLDSRSSEKLKKLSFSASQNIAFSVLLASWKLGEKVRCLFELLAFHTEKLSRSSNKQDLSQPSILCEHFGRS